MSERLPANNAVARSELRRCHGDCCSSGVAHAALLPALGLLAGIVFGVWGEVPVAAGVLLLGAAFPASIAALLMDRGRLVVVSVAAAWTAAGMVLGARAEASARDPPIRRLLRVGSEGPVTLTGVLTEDASVLPNGVSLSLRVRDWARDGRSGQVNGGVLLTVGGQPDPRRTRTWTAGRLLRLPAWLREPARYSNEGVPDHRLGLARRGVALVGSVKSASLVEVLAVGGWIDEAASVIRARVRRLVALSIGARSPRAGGVVTAILIGDRTGLDPVDARMLQEAGTYHVIAISGGNIAILAGCLLLFARLLRLPYRLGLAATAGGLALYVPVAGGGPSVLRATLMAIVYLGARAIDHRSAAASTLAVAATLILCASPLALVDPGFLLTFGATIAIVTLVPAMRGLVDGSPVTRAALTMLAASLASELALLPIGAALFNRVTFAGLALNFLAIPLMSVAQVGGMGVVALQAIAPTVARSVAWVPQVAADWLIDSASLVSWAPWATWRVPAPPAWAIAAYYAALAAWLARSAGLLRIPRSRPPAGAVAAVGAVAGGWVLAAPGSPPWSAALDRLTVVAFDVGQGDSTLVRLPGGRALLVDAGGLGGGARFDVGERVVAPAAWSLGVRSLHAFVATHGDVDHVGGAAAAAAMLRAREVWEGVPVREDPELATLLATAEAARIPWRTVQAGDLLRDRGVIVRVVHPPPADWERRRVRNDDSVVLEVRYGEVSFVLTGDAGIPVEPAITERLDPGATLRVLKVGHHGSAGSTSEALVRAVRPVVAVVSCGRHNRFGHPAPVVLDRLFASGAALFRTDRQGEIVLETDGHVLTVRTFTGEEVVFRAERLSPLPQGRRSLEADNHEARPAPSRGLAGAIEVWLRHTKAQKDTKARKDHVRDD
jgi:competence protein ComEC